MQTKEETKEETKIGDLLEEATDALVPDDWEAGTFNYAANDKQIGMIQERVQARHKNASLKEAIEKTIKASGVVSEDALASSVILALYMHSAFEVGRESGLHDIDALVSATLDKKFEEKSEEKSN